MKIILATFFVFLFFVACQQENITDNEKNKTIELDEKSEQLIRADNKFGLEIFQKIVEGSDEENVMISPLSISVALAMAYNGADGETKSQMEEVLNLNGLTTEEINTSYKLLLAALQSLDEDVVLEIANAIFYADDFAVKQPFLDINKKSYDARVEALDFRNQESAGVINNWVAGQTYNKIEKIVDQLNPTDMMILLNAVYFNGNWSKPFDEDGTQLKTFHKTEKEAFEVPMMHKTNQLEFNKNSLLSFVKLPYGDGNYNMVVLLPNNGNTYEDVLQNLTVSNWQNWMADTEMHDKVVVTMPRFKFEFKMQLKNVLQEMGMSDAFNPNRSDLTKIADFDDLHISSVLHKSFIDVNETGTEAAAVTSVTVGVTSVNPGEAEKIYFTVDKPFVFAITEKDTEAILFIGVVKHPVYD
ncbi:MAG TPA: serpin family protein [Prolixibacteraceae bacterium]|nr:serpin family protein [Prolixibacteraceae bacterium]